MGEYARRKSDGVEIKTGTCEAMYYVRPDQVDQLGNPISGSIDLRNPKHRKGSSFRFPFPWEDSIRVGAFDGPTTGMVVRGATAPATPELHGFVQCSNGRGVLLTAPCPLAIGRVQATYGTQGPTIETPHGTIRYAFNGYSGDVLIVGQKDMGGGVLRLVLRCGACGYDWSTDRDGAEAIAVALRSEADRKDQAPEGSFERTNGVTAADLRVIADRIMAGYPQGVEA